MEMNYANCSELKKDSIYPNIQYLMKINKNIIPLTLVRYVVLSLVQILFSFVSNSLSYITIPTNKRKENLNQG